MKLNPNFVLRQVADTWVILPIGEETLKFDGMIKLNNSGALLWKAMENGKSRNDMADVLTSEYDVSREQALSDVDSFVEKLRQIGCVQ